MSSNQHENLHDISNGNGG